MFKNRNIRKRVISIVEGKIENAQSSYDEQAKDIDETTAESIKVITEQAVIKKEKLEDELVESIIGKFK